MRSDTDEQRARATPTGVQGITEDDIANYLANTPGFFERHAELLGRGAARPARTASARCRCRSGRWKCCATRSRASSGKIIEMIRARPGERGHRRQAAPLDARADAHRQRRRPARRAGARAAARVHGPAGGDPRLGRAPRRSPALRVRAAASSDDVQELRRQPGAPYCGVNSGFEAVQWLDEPAQALSLALIPLRHERLGRRLRPAGARLARPDALHRRHGHRVPGAHRRGRERRR